MDHQDSNHVCRSCFFSKISGIQSPNTRYVIGFDPSAGRFFRQYLLLLLLNQMASALFRFIAAIGRGDLILANTFGSFALVMLFALGGFVLLRENIRKWWIWGYWM
nr:abc transporter g family member 40 [Quercus suber]